MASNPFDISQLNGVNFDHDSIALTQIARGDSQTGAPINLQFSPAAQAFQVDTLTVVNSSYTAGGFEFVYVSASSQFPSYHLPTFGAIEIADPFGGGGTLTLWVHGFTENGLLLTTQQDVFVQRSSGNFYDALNNGDFVAPYIFGVEGLALPSAEDPSYTAPNGIDPSAPFGLDPAVFCFAEGTRIETASGAVAVENLAPGDLAVTASGAHRPIKWIGQILARPARHPRPWEVNPVRVLPHAFGTNLPERDVRLSPGHAVLVDGVLVPVGHLVNGATIVREEVDSIRYFHVELETHDVLLAERLACESYLDDGNRDSFGNASELTQLHGRLDPKSWDDACAPLVAAGPQLVAIRERLDAQAAALGWHKTEEADLAIEVDVERLLPACRAGNRYWFQVPAAAKVRLDSNSAVLSQVMPGLADDRRLGVAIAELRVDGDPIALEDSRLTGGFYPVERHDGTAWRWTNGAAELALDLAEPAMIEVSLLMVAPSWQREAPQLRIVA